MNRKWYFWVIGVCVAIGLLSYVATLHLLTNDPEQIVQEEPIAEKPIVDQDSTKEDVTTVSSHMKIQPYTKIVYQYYYPVDRITKEQEDTPPYFLLDLTLNDLQKLYEDWQVVSFSDAKVVMRRTVEGKSDERYIVGEQDGYVAVFYEEEKEGTRLHELTHTPISSLPEEDRQRLQQGIFVLGDSNLSKILADYES